MRIRGRIFMIATLVAAALLSASCYDSVANAPACVSGIEIVISDDTGKKTIGYDGSLTGGRDSINAVSIAIEDALGYEIMDSGWLDMHGTTSYLIDSIDTGNYTFTIKGAIGAADGTYYQIAEDSYDITITRDTRNIQLPLRSFVDELSGPVGFRLVLPLDSAVSEGVRNGTLSWQFIDADMATPYIGNGYSGSISISTEDDEVEVMFSDPDGMPYSYEPGVYGLMLTYTDSEGGSWTHMDALRLFPGLPATGEASFNGPLNDLEITITIDMGLFQDDIIIPPGGAPASVSEDSIEIELPEFQEGTSVFWFLNGAMLDIEPSLTTGRYEISGLLVGPNSITVVVFDGTNLGSGSETFIVIRE